MWNFLIPAAASLIGGLLTNDKNEDIASANNAYNAEQAGLNRDFQERMSNTAYQRATKDMQQAGLNPMLAYSQGGASSPAGTAATAAANPKIENALGQGVASAIQAKTAIAQVENLEAQNENIPLQGALLRAQERDTQASADLKNAQTNSQGYSAQQTQAQTEQTTVQTLQLKEQIDKIKQETLTERERTLLTAAQAQLTLTQEQLTKGTITLQQWQTKLAQIQTTLEANLIPGSEAQSDVSKTWYGQHIRPLLDDISKLIGSTRNAVRINRP